MCVHKNFSVFCLRNSCKVRSVLPFKNTKVFRERVVLQFFMFTVMSTCLFDGM